MLHMHNTSHIKFAINYVLNERNEKKKNDKYVWSVDRRIRSIRSRGIRLVRSVESVFTCNRDARSHVVNITAMR